MRVVAVVFGVISAFFVFYTVRLLVVTHGLQQLRAGGNGAYIGAAVFPFLALVSGWASARMWNRGTSSAQVRGAR